MNVLFIHQGDKGLGGGQVQMLRVMRGLQAAGVNVRIMCKYRTRQESAPFPRRPRTERWIAKVSQRLGLNDVHGVGAFDIPKQEAFQWADVIDAHSLHANFFSYLALPKITREKPMVFTFHDMWPITGHCHASLECERWKIGCGQCPHLDIEPPVRRDGTAWDWKMKRWAYDRSTLTPVAPSRWLYECTKESMLGGKDIRHIAHGIDTTVYRPLDKATCRSMLGVPEGKKVLLFAVERLDRPLKGADLLISALKMLPESVRKESVLLLLGHSGTSISEMVGIPSIDLGFVANDQLKSIIFSTADVFLHPTRADNFPLVLLESMACGTPVVSFNVGGVPEVARVGETGLLAERDNAGQFSELTAQMVSDDTARGNMAKRCREIVEAEYRIERQVSEYVDLYKELAG